MSPHLLIVDDEPDMLTLLKRSLEPELGCRVDTASSGETALKMIRATDYDLVLADIKMPGISGLEVLEQVKADRGEDITVVMMTAYGHIEMAVEAMKRGAYDFITKPFELRELLARAEAMLRKASRFLPGLRSQDARRWMGCRPSMPDSRPVIGPAVLVDNTI